MACARLDSALRCHCYGLRGRFFIEHQFTTTDQLHTTTVHSGCRRGLLPVDSEGPAMTRAGCPCSLQVQPRSSSTEADMLLFGTVPLLCAEQSRICLKITLSFTQFPTNSYCCRLKCIPLLGYHFNIRLKS